MKLRYFGIGLALICLFAMTAFGQDTGSISGTVRDNTGAVVPGAEVTVTNAAQGLARKTTSNSTGDYLVAGLLAGTYDISVAAKGFKTFEMHGLVLRIAQKARVDADLQVGEVSTTIEVAGAGVAQVETESSELAGTITGKQMSQLILNGRNFTQLVTLAPGVSNQTNQDEGTVGVNGNVSMSINGGREEYNNWELDGGDNMDNGSNSTLNVYPNVDAIAEVKVLTSSYGAQYGRSGSGTIETVTKSGTNAFHGDVFEFVRNKDFNANNFFNNATGVDRPEYTKNDFGYTIGGPVFIPNVYNTGKEKTFFFWAQEWRREIVPSIDPNTNSTTWLETVPNNAERGGNFSDVCPGPECPMIPGTSTSYPNNIVPVNPNAQIVMNALIPQANSGANLYSASPSLPMHWREELLRVDHNFNDKVRLFGRYIHDSWDTVMPSSLWSVSSADFPTTPTSFVGPGISVVGHLTINSSPTLLHEFIFSYTADHITLGQLANVSNTGMTMTGLFNNGFGGKVPAVVFANDAIYGNGGAWGADPGYFPWTNSNPTYTYRYQGTKSAGDHSLYFGAYAVTAEKNEMSTADTQGILTFDASNTGFSTGNAFADFLTGQIGNFQQTNQQLKYYNRYKIVEPYFQDDWRISKRFTLNLGVRVSLYGTYREKYQQEYSFEPSAYNASQMAPIDPVTGFFPAGTPLSGYTSGLVQCGTNGTPAGCMKGHLFNPAPRIGFAWDPMGTGKTSIRAGYGIFYEHTNGNESNVESLEGSAPLALTATQYNISGYTNIGGGGSVSPLTVAGIPNQAIWPYMQQWHLDVQRELAKNTVLSVSYVGSKGTSLPYQQDINQIPALPASLNPFTPGEPMIVAGPGVTNANTDCTVMSVNGVAVTGQALNNLTVACGGNPNLYRPYPGYGSILMRALGANSSYNALQVSANRSVGTVHFSVDYTWSHSIDDSSDGYSDYTLVDSSQRTRASSNFDQRHLLNVSYVYDLPGFKSAGLANKVLGGWQLSGITTFQTGTPVTLYYAGDNAGVGNGVPVRGLYGQFSYVDVVPGVNPNAGVSGTQLYNPAAFTAPTGLTFGDSGRNSLRNPSRTQFDMGLHKRFKVSESKSFEFRAEGFNVFNHSQFILSGNNTYSAGGSFLSASGAHNPRIIQLGAKFLF